MEDDSEAKNSNSPTNQTHNLIEIRRSSGSPSKGPFAITTYARVRAQTNVNGTADENSSSFENSQEILKKVGKNLGDTYLSATSNFQNIGRATGGSGSLSPQLG